jgi:spermidine/putrescine transport system permease protein
MESRRTDWVLIAPATAVFLLLFVGAAVYFFIVRFWSVQFYKLTPDFTFKNNVAAVTTHGRSLLLTLGIAFVIATVSTLLGFLYAWLIRFQVGRWGPVLLFIALITLFGGYLMKIYAWKTVLGGEGVLNSAFMALGLIAQPMEALLYSPLAVIVSLTYFLLPFAILPIYSAMRGLTEAEVESARDLGASSWRLLCDVIIPRSRPGIIAGFGLTFLVSAGDYLTPILVGGKMSMYGQMISPQFGSFFNWPLGAAMSFTILAISLVILAVVGRGIAQVGRQ